jgi:hypothetical protein
MKVYFSSKQIPQLRHLPLTERLAAIQLAQKKLIGPEKLFLNVLKMLVVIPVFTFIVQTSTNWLALVWALLITLFYPAVVKPIYYALCVKYIPPSQAHSEGD